MWERLRRKYFVGLMLLLIAYPVSFAPSLYYLLHYAEPTNESIESFQVVYRTPLNVLPDSVTTGMIHAFGYPVPEARLFAQRLQGTGIRFY